MGFLDSTIQCNLQFLRKINTESIKSVCGLNHVFDVTRQVGLAVGDIDKIQQNALMDRYVLQVSISVHSLGPWL